MAVATTIVCTFMLLIPRSNWPTLLPSSESSEVTAETGDILANLPRAYVPKTLEPLLAEAQANLTRLYAEHNYGPPNPIYAGPGLTNIQRERYSHLRRPPASKASRIAAGASGAQLTPKFMFTTLTRDIAAMLPDMINALAVVTDFVGPQHVSFSILEGPSGDPSAAALEHVLKPLLLQLGVPASAIRIETNAPKIDFSKVNRIEALANLRNDALKPLWEDVDRGYLTRTPQESRRTVGVDVAAVVFFNDVFLHATDFLEVLHQHIVAGAGTPGTGITTAWDWMERDPAYFYDVWVARTIDTGDLFYPIEWTWWAPSDKLLLDSPVSHNAFSHLEPFQAYSSWNGLAVLAPNLFLPPFSVRFRRGDKSKNECAASECSLIATDFWAYGWGRIQVVPSVQLAYSRKTALQTAQMLRAQRRTLGWLDGAPSERYDKTVQWVKDPPKKVRCHPWPEVNGLSANVWETKEWVAPYLL